jgi:hypothetical protein
LSIDRFGEIIRKMTLDPFCEESLTAEKTEDLKKNCAAFPVGDSGMQLPQVIRQMNFTLETPCQVLPEISPVAVAGMARHRLCWVPQIFGPREFFIVSLVAQHPRKIR